MRKFLISTISFLLFFLSTNKMYSQTEGEMRAMWIFNIAYGVTWENEKDISKYTIGVFSSSEEYDALKEIALSRTIHDKPVEIIRYSGYENVKQNHIIYITKNENAYLGFIYNKLKGKNVLIISDRNKQPEYSVINLDKPGNGTQPFTINAKLYKMQRLNFSPQLLRLGGDRQVLREMQVETNAELIKAQKELIEKDKIIEELKKKIAEQEELINKK